jgi:hypothetical protein
MSKTVHCPECGGAKIRETNEAIAFLLVTVWEFDDNGVPMPGEYDTTGAEPDWEISDDVKPYRCWKCGWVGALDELDVREATVAALPEGQPHG